MEQELSHLDDIIHKEIQKIKEKYSKIKIDIITKYRSNAGKYKRKSIPKAVKDKVWDTYIGKKKGVGKCFCCRCEIDSKNFDCGHVISVRDGAFSSLFRQTLAISNSAKSFEGTYCFV